MLTEFLHLISFFLINIIVYSLKNLKDMVVIFQNVYATINLKLHLLNFACVYVLRSHISTFASECLHFEEK